MKELVSKENLHYEYSLHNSNIHLYGKIGFFSHILFYLVLNYVFGYREFLGLRIIIALLFLAFVYFPKVNWKLYHAVYYETIMALSLPLFFSFMMLENNVSVYWATSYIFATMIYVFVSRPIIVVVVEILVFIPFIGKFAELVYQDGTIYKEAAGIFLISWLTVAIILVVKRRLIYETLKNSNLRESMEEQNEIFSSLIYISSELSMYDDLDMIFKVFIERYQVLMPLTKMGLFLSFDGPHNIIMKEMQGISDEEYNYISMNLKTLIISDNIHLQQEELVKNGEKWYFFNKEFVSATHSGKTQYNLCLILVGPIIRDFQIGIIQIFMEQLTGNVRTRIQAKELELYSNTDPLTQLYNRNALNEAITREKRHNIDKHPFSIIFGDVNGLKYVNDRYGHTDGDNLLRMCSKIIQSVIPSEASAFRYGGDEIVILFRNTSLTEVTMHLEKLEKAFENREVLCTNEVTHEQTFERVSMAFGAASSAHVNISDIIDLADVEMRKKKELHYKKSDRGRYR